MAADLSQHVRDSVERIFTDYPDSVRLIGGNGRVVLQNVAAGELTPWAVEHRCRPGEPAGQIPCVACRRERVLRGGTSERWHLAIPRPGSPEVNDFFEITQLPIRDADGRVEAVLEIVRDETTTLGLEHFLIGESERQKDELDKRTLEAHTLGDELAAVRDSQAEILSRDRLIALGRLVAGVAHEVHTPLGAVLSSADVLQRSFQRLREAMASPADDESRAAAARHLDALDSAVEVVGVGARRIERVIRNLRSFSRLDEAPRKAVDLREGLESALQLLDYLMRDRIRVVRDYATMPLVTCRADAMNQVFMNLLLNAVQAISGRGEIRVGTRVEQDDAVVEVADTGMGIAAADLKRIFDPGFTTKSRGAGTGLGLAICKQIVNDHGGEIAATSDAGEGSRFIVRLPLTREDPR